MLLFLEEAVGTDMLTFRSFIPSLSAQRSEFTRNTQTEHHGKMEKVLLMNKMNGLLPALTASNPQASGEENNLSGKRKQEYLCPDRQSGKRE